MSRHGSRSDDAGEVRAFHEELLLNGAWQWLARCQCASSRSRANSVQPYRGTQAAEVRPTQEAPSMKKSNNEAHRVVSQSRQVTRSLPPSVLSVVTGGQGDPPPPVNDGLIGDGDKPPVIKLILR
jgi:hypothetical protein